MAGIEGKVAEMEEAIAAQTETNGVDLKEKAEEAKVKVEEAKKALANGEYQLVLTLSKNSNEILKILYGDIHKVVNEKDATVETEIKADTDAGIGADKGQVKGKATTSPDELGAKSKATTSPDELGAKGKATTTGVISD